MNGKWLLIGALEILAITPSMFAQAPRVLRQVDPVIPEGLKPADVSGAVVVRAIVAKDGTVKEVTYISGPELLAKSVMDAVRQWKYEPPLGTSGQPSEMTTTVSMSFNMSKGPAPGPAQGTGRVLTQQSAASKTSANCPDWSPKFDQIDEPILLDVVREQSKKWGFDSLAQQGFSYQEQIAAAEEHIADFKTKYERDEQVWKELGNGPKPTVTTDDCLLVDPDTKSATAAVCDQRQQAANILMAEGMIELLRCRASASARRTSRGTPARPVSPPSGRK